MKRPFFYVIAAALILAALIYFFILPSSHRTPGDTVQAARGEAVQAVYATGVVEPVYWAGLAADKAARVVEILKDEGEKVSKGEIVARLDSSVEQANLQEAKARLSFVIKERERIRTLSRSGFAPTRQLQDIESEYAELNARISSIQQAIERLTLISPIDGTVLRREVELGETATAGETLFWVGKQKPLRITAEVDEEDIGLVQLGQKALIKADAYPDKVFEGKVSEITPKGDPVNKVFRVRIALPDDSPLLISMTAEINIVIRVVEDALLIPLESVVHGSVWKVTNGKAIETQVTLGIRGEQQVEVLKGLAEGENILARPPVEEKK